MRTCLRTLAVMTVAVVPVGVAASSAAAANSSAKKSSCKAAKKRGVTYILRGTLVTDATATAVVMTPTGGNLRGRRALGASGTYDAGVTIPILPGPAGGRKYGGCTMLTRVVTPPIGKKGGPTVISGVRAPWSELSQGWTNLKAGDPVLISWKAKRGATLATLGPAHRVVELRAGS